MLFSFLKSRQLDRINQPVPEDITIKVNDLLQVFRLILMGPVLRYHPRRCHRKAKWVLFL